ncbi:DUF1569 domain-containing protein [Aquimarina sp. I32.4]|uniref:DUF1569 domain-containing protein n=1 Tax=Aquimarina sp. I32.4 TaxID=2053903 RepID=UPI000CDE6732|nr:DUF1569 domain-containing protein [Aquimarina sp. I32.4]
MKSLFDPLVLNEIENRINKLSTDSSAAWGKMNVSQMLHHCQFPLKTALKKNPLTLKPNFLAKLFFKKSMYNDKPWRKNLPTHSKLKVVKTKEFTPEREILLELVAKFSNHRDKKEWEPHPIFGKFTNEQWGQLQYKHLDHHLQQFDV